MPKIVLVPGKDFFCINLCLIKNNSILMLLNAPYHGNPQTFPQLINIFVKAQTEKLVKVIFQDIVVHRTNLKPITAHIPY